LKTNFLGQQIWGLHRHRRLRTTKIGTTLASRRPSDARVLGPPQKGKFRSPKRRPIGLFNSRGVTSRAIEAGGDIERERADQLQRQAVFVRPYSPKLAEAFEQMAYPGTSRPAREDIYCDRLFEPAKAYLNCTSIAGQTFTRTSITGQIQRRKPACECLTTTQMADKIFGVED